MRLMATHRLFDPHDPEVKALFSALEVDPIYARLCARQNCFRARLSAEPWRIGIRQTMPPRSGVWPVADKHLPARKAWIAEYERTAAGFSACRYVMNIGSGVVQSKCAAVIELHDESTRAHSNLPIA